MLSRSRYRFPWSRYPALRLAFLFSAGILVASWFPPRNRTLLIAVFTLFLICWIWTEWWSTNSVTTWAAVISGTAYLLIILLFGFLRFDFHQDQIKKEMESAGKISLYTWDEFRLTGVIADVLKTSSGRTAVNLDVLKTTLEEKVWQNPYRIRLYADREMEVSASAGPGDSLWVVIRLMELNDAVNPGEFDYRRYLQRQGIYLHGDIREIERVREADNRRSWMRLRNGVHDRIELLFDEHTAPVAKAILTGHREEMDRYEQQAFSRAGLAHIMAVSGMHVGFVVVPFMLITPRLLSIRHGEWILLFMITGILVFYAGLSGFSPSVSRASLMAWLLVVRRLKNWMSHPLNLMGGSAFLLLLIDPYQLYDIGFQLSYGAVLTILLVMPVLRQAIPERLLYTLRGKAMLGFLLSLVVQVSLYPIIAWYFGEFPLLGPVANLLAVPALTAVVPYSLFLIPFADLIPEVVRLWVNSPNQYGVRWLSMVADLLGSRSRSWISADQSSIWLFLVWVILIGLVATIKIPMLRTGYLITLFIALTVTAGRGLSEKFKPAEMYLTVLDVGQGDAFHIETPGGKQILIDTGRWTPSGNSGERVLLPYLKYRGIERLNAVILTHPHADHIGGAAELMDHIGIDTLYYCGLMYDSEIFRTYQQKAEDKEIPLKAVKKGDLLDIDPSIRLFIVGPDGTLSSSNPNDHSVVVKLVYHQAHFLFTGDAQKHQEMRMIRRYGDFLQSDFLKLGHHGSRTSSSPDFLAAVQPEKAAVSLAYRNRYQHPHREAIERVRQYTDRIYFTSLEGSMIFRTDGVNIQKEE